MPKAIVSNVDTDSTLRTRSFPLRAVIAAAACAAFVLCAIFLNSRIAEANDAAAYQALLDSSGLNAILDGTGAFATTRVTGTGDAVIELPSEGACVVTVSHHGAGNFAAWAQDETGSNLSLLVNVIGSYQGVVTTYPYRAECSQLALQTTGDWTLDISPITALSPAANGQDAEGDAVLYLELDGAKTISATSQSDTYFSARVIGKTDAANLSARSAGQTMSTAWDEAYALVIVKSEGSWSVSWS